jgi:hypothetical protein
MSSAPTTTAHEYDADYDDDAESEAARHTEEFLASLMHASKLMTTVVFPPVMDPCKSMPHDE